MVNSKYSKCWKINVVSCFSQMDIDIKVISLCIEMFKQFWEEKKTSFVCLSVIFSIHILGNKPCCRLLCCSCSSDTVLSDPSRWREWPRWVSAVMNLNNWCSGPVWLISTASQFRPLSSQTLHAINKSLWCGAATRKRERISSFDQPNFIYGVK